MISDGHFIAVVKRPDDKQVAQFLKNGLHCEPHLEEEAMKGKVVSIYEVIEDINVGRKYLIMFNSYAYRLPHPETGLSMFHPQHTQNGLLREKSRTAPLPLFAISPTIPPANFTVSSSPLGQTPQAPSAPNCRRPFLSCARPSPASPSLPRATGRKAAATSPPAGRATPQNQTPQWPREQPR
jgi:hypothetical protein